MIRWNDGLEKKKKCVSGGELEVALHISFALHIMRQQAMKVQAPVNDVFIKSMVLNDNGKDTSDPNTPLGGLLPRRQPAG